MRLSALGFRLTAIGAAILLVAAPLRVQGQERGAIALGELIDGLGVSARVLMIGAHPDDEDTNLITWLARGRHVETAYLSLTRGDGGQNIIGNELGEALGVIRTEELLAARRIDGARQYFTRAFDFGFSKDTIDTYSHWSRDSILGDVVRVVRQFRPHVIVAVFSGTRADGHGHHQVSGLLARVAYDIAHDTVRFPQVTYGAPWTTLKFYRAARFNSQAGTLSMDVGEYSPLLGRSFGEIAGESRSQHKSQGFGSAQRKGPILDFVRREASRVNESTPPRDEKGLFDGIDTSLARFRPAMKWPVARAAVDSLPAAIARARAAYDPRRPELLNGLLGHVARLRLLLLSCPREFQPCPTEGNLYRDLETTAWMFDERLSRARVLASGVSVEAVVASDVVATDSRVRAVITVYNRGRDSVRLSRPEPIGTDISGDATRWLPPGGVLVDTIAGIGSIAPDEPAWLRTPRNGDMFAAPSREWWWPLKHGITYSGFVARDSALMQWQAPFQVRSVDQIRGESWRDMVVVRPVNLVLGSQTMYVPADVPIDRIVPVTVWTAGDTTRDVQVSLDVPAGLRVDSATRTIRLSARDGRKTLEFRVRGQLRAGERRITALARSGSKDYGDGYDLIDYEHIRPQRIPRPASARVVAVDAKAPDKLRVAYIPGVGDNVAPMLSQLGVSTTVVSAADIARTDLAGYSTVIVGPRAYEAHPELLSANPKLFDFARKGGVLLVQYGQYEMLQPGAMPFPITLGRPATRVTDETAAVTIDAPNARELSSPNRITVRDFDGWVQERSLYMPSTFDSAYRTLFAMNDPGEPPNKGGVLIAPLGQGLYIYTTMSFFRQLPAGNAGAARLFVNLLSAKLAPTVTP